ncbi:MAG: HEPN domain-containing protein [Cyanobacteria bacterium SZAS-4]|nr:HEPN domain-containing protein [Cyanobacteria bacterium SZAS-4]
MAVDRKIMAKTYRLKSDESYKAACKSLDEQMYRAVCNRSWYAVMQIITAATYEDLTEVPVPADGKPNWKHERQSSLFRFLAKKHQLPKEQRGLAAEIDIMRERRNDADYVSPNERHANAQSAKRSLETAEKVRAAIFKLIGNRWDAHVQTVLAKDISNG